MGREDPIDEALGILQEECSEVIKEASKIFRSGMHYMPANSDFTNQERLHREIADVLIIISMCELVGAVNMASFNMAAYIEEKKIKMKIFTSLDHDTIDRLG